VKQLRLGPLPIAHNQHQQRNRASSAVYLDILTTGYAFNGGGNSRLMPDQTSNAYIRRDGEDKLPV
jgi:hypothetical protein